MSTATELTTSGKPRRRHHLKLVTPPRETALTAAERGKLAAQMLPVAASLACAVRSDDAEAIGELLAGYGTQELWALIVVLAALVPVDDDLGDLLAWVTWDEHGRPLPPEPVRGWRPTVDGLKPCGTPAAFRCHQRNGEPACGPCREAHNASRRERESAARAVNA